MKDNLKRLVAIGKVIDLSMFYVISIYSDNIKLQCSFSRDMIKTLNRHKFNNFETDAENGWTVCRRNNIEVILT
jgi:hypothetical protein